MNEPILKQENGIWTLRDSVTSKLLWKERDETRTKGVTYDKRTGKYIAQIRVNGKNKNLGYFDTQELASAKYNAYREFLDAKKVSENETKNEPIENVKLF